MYTKDEKAKIKWSCRRGMLELDVVIKPFFEECFDDLNKDQQRYFVALLEFDDPILFNWIMRQERSDNFEHAALVDKIVAYNLKKFS